MSKCTKARCPMQFGTVPDDCDLKDCIYRTESNMSEIINITFGTLMTSLDDEVVRAVQKVGIDVNKEELLKALELYHNLVRCKECKWSKANGTYQWCGRLDSTARITADDFCSYGEREDE